MRKPEQEREVIGLVPAAGYATRLSPLPCSKEVYPIGLRAAEDGNPRPKVVSHYLLSNMRCAGAMKAFVVLREGKWDIPCYYNDGTALLDMHLAYLMMHVPYGPPFTLDQAYPFIGDATVLLGFPDMLFEPPDAFVRVLSRLSETRADVVLGVWTLQPADLADDRLVIDSSGRVQHIEVKSTQLDLPLTWVIAAWAPSFTKFMHVYLLDALNTGQQMPKGRDGLDREMIVGDVMAAAVDGGLYVDTVQFPGARYLDIGTPDALVALNSTGRPSYLT